MRVFKYDHITPILKSLHWLHVLLRIEYKFSLLTHQCIYGEAPPFLKELLIPQTSTRVLCSVSAYLLKPPRTKPHICEIAVDAFKCGLKTNLFRRDLVDF